MLLKKVKKLVKIVRIGKEKILNEKQLSEKPKEEIKEVKQDEELLMSNENLFARKFSEIIDPDIIQHIYTKIKQENKSNA